jgi:hydrogenase maturation protease
VRVWSVGSARFVGRGRLVGSHGLGVADAVELGRSLGRLPRRLTIVGVEGMSFTLGSGISGPVLEHLDEAVRAVVSALTPDLATSAGSDP